MILTKRVGFFCGATALTLTGVAGAATVDADTNARIAELEAQVAALTAAQGDNWLTEQRSAEVRSLVQDVLADADTRTSLLQSGMTGGWDNGFWLGSPDGNYMLRVSGQVQVRYVYNFQDESPVDDNRSGFENPRTKLIFDGHIIDKSWKYKVQGAFSTLSDDGEFELEDAYIQKSLDNGWNFKAGQLKLPFNREELVSSKYQLAVERSLVNEEFNLDRAAMVMVGYDAEQFRAEAAFSNGAGTSNSGALTRDTEFALTARGEFLAAGNWKQFDDFTSWQEEDYGAMIGAAVHYEREEYGSAATDELETFGFTADASVEGGGWGIFGSFYYFTFDDDDSVDVDPIAFTIQGSFMFTPDWEAFARYEWADSDIDSVEELSLVTVGVTKYWKMHSMKWQSDIGWGINEIEAVWASGRANWRTDSDDEDGQIVLRTQLQLLF